MPDDVETVPKSEFDRRLRAAAEREASLKQQLEAATARVAQLEPAAARTAELETQIAGMKREGEVAAAFTAAQVGDGAFRQRLLALYDADQAGKPDTERQPLAEWLRSDDVVISGLVRLAAGQPATPASPTTPASAPPATNARPTTTAPPATPPNTAPPALPGKKLTREDFERDLTAARTAGDAKAAREILARWKSELPQA